MGFQIPSQPQYYWMKSYHNEPIYYQTNITRLILENIFAANLKTYLVNNIKPNGSLKMSSDSAIYGTSLIIT